MNEQGTTLIPLVAANLHQPFQRRAHPPGHEQPIIGICIGQSILLDIQQSAVSSQQLQRSSLSPDG
jgi:hypothetical protein